MTLRFFTWKTRWLLSQAASWWYFTDLNHNAHWPHSHGVPSWEPVTSSHSDIAGAVIIQIQFMLFCKFLQDFGCLALACICIHPAASSVTISAEVTIPPLSLDSKSQALVDSYSGHIQSNLAMRHFIQSNSDNGTNDWWKWSLEIRPSMCRHPVSRYGLSPSWPTPNPGWRVLPDN